MLFYYYSYLYDLAEYFLMTSLSKSAKADISNSGNRVVRLMSGLSDLCACKGVPQKYVQGR